MKRRLSLLLILCLFLGACSERTVDTEVNTIEVYRVLKAENQTEGELLRAETIVIEADADPLHETLDALSKQSEDPNLDRSLPADVSIDSYDIDGTELILEISESYLELKGIQKTLTDYCITLSLCAVEGIASVSIYVNGQPVSIGLESEDVLLFDSDESPYKKQLRLYFTDADGRYLSSEYHILSVSEDEDLERYVIEELLRGPNNNSLVSAIPEGTRLLSVEIQNRICVVELTSEFYVNQPDSILDSRLALYAIVNSLTSLSEVEQVRFKIEGTPLQRYGALDLSDGLRRCESIIGPYSGASRELDVDLFYELAGTGKLCAIPSIILNDDYLGTESSVFRALTEAESEAGLISLLYQKEMPLSISMSGGVCAVDLPHSWTEIPSEHLALCLDAVTATLCSLDNVNGVIFTLEGEPLDDDEMIRTTDEEIILR